LRNKMSKTISEIYKEYKIFPRLENHMLRVAAVASIICDSIDFEIDKEKILTACLLHDMGNILKSKLDYFPDFNEDELKYWQKVKDEYIKKYGEDEHEANIEIAKELGVSQEVIDIMNLNRFSLICQNKASNDIYIKIMQYADNRVGPSGILSYEGRMNEAKERYKDTKDFIEENRLKLASCGKEIEKQIFSKCKIRPEDINDETVASIVLALKDFVIK